MKPQATVSYYSRMVRAQQLIRSIFGAPWRLASTALLVASLVACGERPFRGITIDPPRELPVFAFRQADSTLLSTVPRAGRPILVFFGYTHCPDVCPVTLADWVRVKRALGEQGNAVRWLFVSVDPARDTPAVAEAYAQQFDPSFSGVSPDSATWRDMQDAFAVTSYETPGVTPEDYLVTHASQSFLVDDTGRLRAMYSFNSGTDAVVADLTRLLR